MVARTTRRHRSTDLNIFSEFLALANVRRADADVRWKCKRPKIRFLFITMYDGWRNQPAAGLFLHQTVLSKQGERD